MKRSEINKALKELEAMCAKYKCYLPPFCNFTPEEWQEKGHEYDEVRDCMLGWDITDYGLGNFDKFGFSLITIRNGWHAAGKISEGLRGEAAVSERGPDGRESLPLVQN